MQPSAACAAPCRMLLKREGQTQRLQLTSGHMCRRPFAIAQKLNCDSDVSSLCIACCQSSSLGCCVAAIITPAMVTLLNLHVHSSLPRQALCFRLSEEKTIAKPQPPPTPADAMPPGPLQPDPQQAHLPRGSMLLGQPPLGPPPSGGPPRFPGPPPASSGPGIHMHLHCLCSQWCQPSRTNCVCCFHAQHKSAHRCSYCLFANAHLYTDVDCLRQSTFSASACAYFLAT